MFIVILAAYITANVAITESGIDTPIIILPRILSRKKYNTAKDKINAITAESRRLVTDCMMKSD